MSTAGLRALRAGTEKSPIVPSPSTPQGGRRRFVQTQLLVTNALAGVFTDTVARFRLDIPSVRLHVKVSVDFRPDNAESTDIDQSGPNMWQFGLEAWNRTEDGLFLRSNTIISAVPAPATYEHSGTAVDQWRGTLTAPNAGGVGTQLVPGKWWVNAMWEPTAGYNPPLDDSELPHLFQACHLNVDQGLTTFEGTE